MKLLEKRIEEKAKRDNFNGAIIDMKMYFCEGFSFLEFYGFYKQNKTK